MSVQFLIQIFVLAAVVVSQVYASSLFTAPTYATGAGPRAVVLGDFNRDGLLDMAVANAGESNVTVRLGKGKGTFGARLTYKSGSGPAAIVTADFNRDGLVDLAIGCLNGTLTVLLGHGDGTFGSPLNSYGGYTSSIVTGDFNHDGKPDVAVADSGYKGIGNTVNVLFGNGDGTFAPMVQYHIGEYDESPQSIAAGDLNRDGNLDLAVVSSNYVTLMIGNSNGTFILQSIPDRVRDVALADFNSDGRLDVAVMAANPGAIRVYLGNGNGTVKTPALTSPIANYPAFLVARDLNGDGKPDLAISFGQYYEPERLIAIMLGNGDGSFRTYRGYAAGSSPVGMAIGDLNKDGQLDIVTANMLGNNVSLLLGSGNAQFQSPVDYPAGGDVGAGNFNGDKYPDVVAAGGDSLRVWLNTGTGLLKPGPAYKLGKQLLSVVAADMNRDSRSDLVVGNCTDSYGNAGDAFVLLGNGNGTFQPALATMVTSCVEFVTVFDLNGDLNPDLVVGDSGGNLLVLMGNGTGRFGAPGFYHVGNEVPSVAIGDFNGDHHPDLAAIDHAKISIFLSDGDSSFIPGPTYPSDWPVSIAAADFNGDGKPDLAVASGGGGSSSGLSVLLGNGDGSFQPAVTYAAGTVYSSVTAKDLNRDTELDLIACDVTNHAIKVLNGMGNGTFAAPVSYGADCFSSVITPDLNADGSQDVVTGGGYVGGFTVTLNAGGVVTKLTSTANPSLFGKVVTFALVVSPGVKYFNMPVPSGTVTFKEGTQVLATASVNAGKASFTTSALSIGTHAISAIYSGDAKYNSKVATITQVVVQ